jgi:hypothetical protein
MISKNERAMVIELAKSVVKLSSAMILISETLPDGPSKKLALSDAKDAQGGMEEIIKLIDAEWLPK